MLASKKEIISTTIFSWDKAETCRFPYLSTFSIMTRLEALKLIHTLVQRPDSSYWYVQHLFIEIN